MKQKIIPIILAGGQGTRLWPASLPHIPKQFIKIGQHSLMYHAIERANRVADEELIIVTGEQYLEFFPSMLEAELLENGINIDNITLIGEPVAKNTAPAIAYAVKYVEEKYENAILLVITADHLISPVDIFAKDVLHAVEAAELIDENAPQGRIVTFGIKPTSPETGYGYIEAGNNITEEAREVKDFKEKPNKQKAEEYIARGNYFWNSGMFCFPVQLMKNELQKYSKEIDKHILSLEEFSWKQEKKSMFSAYIPQHIDFERLEKISIDYAVMEHTRYVGVIQAHFDWNDIGSWDEAIDLLESSDAHYIVDAERVGIFSDIPVGISGISDITVVIKNNRALIMKRGSGQSISEIAKKDK